MVPDDQRDSNISAKLGGPFDLSLRVVILFILGVFMIVFGLLLFKIHRGDLPYNPDSMYGLILVIVSLQMITIGRTPFGDLRRSWLLVIIGICTAVIGMVACFIPGLMTGFIRVLVGILLLAGGIGLLIKLFTAEDKAKKWMNIPGTLQQLTVACAFEYLMTIVIGLVILFPGIVTDTLTAGLLIVYGISFIYLAWCVRKVTLLYPAENAKTPHVNNAASAGARQKGIFKLFMGGIPFPSRCHTRPVRSSPHAARSPALSGQPGHAPVSIDGQLGLLLFIMAVQMLTTGYTPVGEYRRSGLLMAIGMVFATMGIIACIVPGVLTGVIFMLLGVLNISGGTIPMVRRFIPMLHKIRQPPAQPEMVNPLAKKLLITMTVFNIVTIIFGITVFVPGLIAGLAFAGFLVLYGLLLFEMAYLLWQVPEG